MHFWSHKNSHVTAITLYHLRDISGVFSIYETFEGSEPEVKGKGHNMTKLRKTAFWSHNGIQVYQL